MVLSVLDALFPRVPLAPTGSQFFCLPGGADGLRDGWFRVSWNPNWTGADTTQARAIRRQLRGRWIAIRRRDGVGGPIFRRLSYSNDAAMGPPTSDRAIAVRLSWDDRIALSCEAGLEDDSFDKPIGLLLEVPRGIDWLRIVTRLPQENAEATLLALVSLALAVVALCFGFR